MPRAFSHHITLRFTDEQFDSLAAKSKEYGVVNGAYARAVLIRDLSGISLERQLCPAAPPRRRMVNVNCSPEMRAVFLGSSSLVHTAVEAALDANDVTPVKSDGTRDTQNYCLRLPRAVFDRLCRRCRALRCTRGAFVRGVFAQIFTN